MMKRLFTILCLLSVPFASGIAGTNAVPAAAKVVAQITRDEKALSIFKSILAMPQAKPDRLVQHIANNLSDAYLELTPTTPTVDWNDYADIGVSTNIHEFGCTLPLPWSQHLRHVVSTNADGRPFLIARVLPGVEVTLWDPDTPSDVDLLFDRDLPSAVLRIGLESDTRNSKLALFSSAMQASPKHSNLTNTVAQTSQLTALLIYKRATWPFATDTLYEIKHDDVTVFQFGSPEKDRKVLLEIFAGKRHATVYIEAVLDKARITQKDILIVVKHFRIDTEQKN